MFSRLAQSGHPIENRSFGHTTPKNISKELHYRMDEHKRIRIDSKKQIHYYQLLQSYPVSILSFLAKNDLEFELLFEMFESSRGIL